MFKSMCRFKIERLLDSVDAVVYLLDYTKLKTQEEQELLVKLRSLNPRLFGRLSSRLFFCVNKVDQVRSAHLVDICQPLLLGVGFFFFFEISARLAASAACQYNPSPCVMMAPLFSCPRAAGLVLVHCSVPAVQTEVCLVAVSGAGRTEKKRGQCPQGPCLLPAAAFHFPPDVPLGL